MLYKKFFNYIFAIALLTSSNGFFTNSSWAQNSSAYNGVRNTTGSNCNAETADEENDNGERIAKDPCYTSSYDDTNFKCALGDFKFDPFTSIDIDWNYGNDTCIGYISGTAVGLFAAFSACRLLCPTPPNVDSANKIKEALDKIVQSQKSTFRKNAEYVAKTAQTAQSGSGGAQSVLTNTAMIIDPLAVIELGIFTSRCFTLAESANCCTAAASCSAAYGTAIGILGGIYETAKTVFENVRICGEGYKIFTKNPVSKIYSKNLSPYAKFLKECFVQGANSTVDINLNLRFNNLAYSRFFDSQQGLNTQNMAKANCKNIAENKSLTNQYYREYIYSGIEYTDNGTNACNNPNWNDATDYLGYSKDGKQRYYFAGPGEAPNFACSRFLAKGIEDDEGFKAYECCNKRSQETLCLERFDKTNQHYLFCSLNNRDCNISFSMAQPVVKYKVFESINNQSYLCAKTYSVCPYDHNVAGGTDIADVFKYRPSITTNFCQYMRHCIKKPPLAKFAKSTLPGYFFAESCKNLVGDSQFVNGLNTLKYSPINSRNFSAPIVQCLKETLESNFLGTAGRTICRDNDSYVDGKDNCISFSTKEKTEILYKKGDKIQTSAFQKIQNQLRNIVRFALIFAVLFFGFQVLLAVPEMHINKKTISVFLVKFGLVSFFALGNAWQGFFVDSILNVSSEISNITFQPNKINDGCNFPKYSYLEIKSRRAGDIVNPDEYKNNPISYPPGKNYLRIWDTMDCKLALAIGYGPEVTTSNLLKMIFAGFLTGPRGIIIFLAAFAYAFLLFSIILRAIHITVMSLLGTILLIYVSPITITCSLFERTKGIFENWWKQLLGFILQPMILFAYLGLLLTIFDYVFIGDAKFVPSKSKYNLPTLACENWTDPATNTVKEPNNTSIYCIFNFPKFKSYTGLEVFDLAIPILTSLNKDKINVIFKAAILMFVFFNFLDKVTFLARKLVGGSELKADKAPNIMGKLKKFSKGVQERALNSTKNIGVMGANKAKSIVASGASKNEDVGVSKGGENKDSQKTSESDGFTSKE